MADGTSSPDVEIAYPLLLHFQNAVVRRAACASTAASSSSPTLPTSSSPSSPRCTPRACLDTGDPAHTALFAFGSTLGEKTARQLLRKNKKVISEHRDAAKFVCREMWTFCFGKQADRLQINRDTGGFVIWDNDFRPVRHLFDCDGAGSSNSKAKDNYTVDGVDDTEAGDSEGPGRSSVDYRALALTIWRGLIQGAVQWLRSEFALRDSRADNEISAEKKDKDVAVVVNAEAKTDTQVVFYLDFQLTA
eukprot:g7548.t1